MWCWDTPQRINFTGNHGPPFVWRLSIPDAQNGRYYPLFLGLVLGVDEVASWKIKRKIGCSLSLPCIKMLHANAKGVARTREWCVYT